MNGLTRFQQLSQQYKLQEALADCASPIPPGEVVRIPLPLAEKALVKAVAEIEKKYLLRGFINAEGYEDAGYQNISLTCNPALAGDPHYSTLGSAALSKKDFVYGNSRTAAILGSLQDSYYDTYGFRVWTPAAQNELACLTSKLKRSVVRSRLSVIRAGQIGPTIFNWGWHKDEPVFENLRVNIHVNDSVNHRIQIMQKDRMPISINDPELVEHCFESGFGYSWDTHLPHRACVVGLANQDRAAIVLGFSPWFDFDANQDSWLPNGFFGKKHPLQMLLDGDIL